ncbi:MAG: polyprenyl synthetase family protein [Planctomycetes bacterium]|nr:polyprenyl synthetase family protein [Planctomycetota bacterium]
MPEPWRQAERLHRPETAERAEPNRDQVPQARDERERLLAAVREYVAERRPVPPFSLAELQLHAARVLERCGGDRKYLKWLAVLVSNEAWWDRVASVPFSRRLLLLPKCLRSAADCEGAMDEFGLVCADCGRCPIHDFKTGAEAAGYVSLVAEGTPAVMTLIRTGQIEAVIGVSCLSALESIYPLMEAAAVPGIAIPLLYDGCVGTAVDVDWVWDALHATGAGGSRRLDVDALRHEVETWFAPDALDATLGPVSGETERIARAWLARSGKRWRPLLALGAFEASRAGSALRPEFRRVALAVECFHKASLVHDDIEDDDATRYGEQTLHEQYGIPVALNVGDFLLGEGYRLIGEADFPAEPKAEMLRAAARGHRDLTIGQGSELCWARHPQPLATAEVIDIFRHKTAPAFEVALRLGAIAGDAGEETWGVLHRYSEALGIAYQISDDLKDFRGEDDPSDVMAMRPSILLAIAHERARGPDRPFFEAVWRRAAEAPPDEVRRRLEALGVEDEARRLMAVYEDAAMRSLEPLTSSDLKGLLRRVIFKIFRRLPKEGSPGDSEARHAPGRGSGSPPSA